MQEALQLCAITSNANTLPHFLPYRRQSRFLSAVSTRITTVSLPPKLPQPPSRNPNSNFREKLLFLDSLGLDVVSLRSAHPPIISVPFDHIKSTVDFIHSIGLSSHDIRRVLSMCPEVLASTPSQLLPVVTFLLREARVEGRDLRRVIHRRPRLLASTVETRLRPTMYFLQSTVGIEEIGKHTHLLSCSVEEKFIPRIEYLQKLGFSYNDTISMFRQFPSLFCYSIEENFEPKFDYFVVEMGRELRELRAFPHYFSFSLENRIKPRHRKCVEKKVCLPLPVMLKSSERRFRDRLEVCFSSSMPISIEVDVNLEAMPMKQL